MKTKENNQFSTLVKLFCPNDILKSIIEHELVKFQEYNDA